MHLKTISPEVFVVDEPIAQIGEKEIEFLKTKLAALPRGRVRICAHQSDDDLVHEMIIALRPDTYLPPHKHLGKSESFHVIEGAVDVIIFNETGGVTQVIHLAARDRGGPFYYRLSQPLYHTLRITSDVLVIHETTNGPFRQAAMLFAPWAPAETDTPAAINFKERISREANKL